MTIPLPAGYELPDVPEGETIQLPVTFSVSAGGLVPVELDGFPIAPDEEELEEAPEEGPEGEDFMSAVNRQLQ